MDFSCPPHACHRIQNHHAPPPAQSPVEPLRSCVGDCQILGLLRDACCPIIVCQTTLLQLVQHIVQQLVDTTTWCAMVEWMPMDVRCPPHACHRTRKVHAPSPVQLPVDPMTSSVGEGQILIPPTDALCPCIVCQVNKVVQQCNRCHLRFEARNIMKTTA